MTVTIDDWGLCCLVPCNKHEQCLLDILLTGPVRFRSRWYQSLQNWGCDISGCCSWNIQSAYRNSSRNWPRDQQCTHLYCKGNVCLLSWLVGMFTVLLFLVCCCRLPVSVFEDVPVVEFMYLLFAHMLGESYCRWLSSLLFLCYVFRGLLFLLCL